MRLTRKKYERAKKIVSNAESQKEIVRQWEDAMRRLGDIGKQVTAITIKDGKIKAECELDEK